MNIPIADYAIIGNAYTAALVSRGGSIDWLCLPRFDSESVFAALLGEARHGRWLIAPEEPPEEPTGRCSRRYRGDTGILETRFETADGTVTVIDFMPPRGQASDIVRLVRCERGRVKMRMELIIRFGFGRDIPWVKRADGGALKETIGDVLPVQYRSS